MIKAGVIVNDCGLPVRLMGVCGEECHFTFVGVEDHFLACAPIGDGDALKSIYKHHAGFVQVTYFLPSYRWGDYVIIAF